MMQRSSRVAPRRVGGLVAVALLVSLLAAMVPAAIAAAQGSETPRLESLVPALNVRSGPGTNYAVISGLKPGQQVEITGRNKSSGWWQVKLATGRTGWVSGAPSLVRVTGDTANVAEVTPPPAPTGGAAQAARPGGKGILVFQVASGGPIYVANPDGSGLRQLTTGIDPALSPDGKQVAFTRWDSSTPGTPGSVWVINVDGSGERKVHDGVRQPKSPAWSPDGTRLAINMQQGGTLEGVCYCPGRLPQPGDCPRDPVYVDGKEVTCFGQPAHAGWGLRVLDLNSGSYQDTPRDFASFTPTWDPANAWRVVYAGERGLMNLDVNRMANYPLTGDLSDRSPAFSPDGKRIAVAYHQHDHWDIHVLNADGSGRVRITETPLSVTMAGKPVWNNVAPTWSPDGKQIAFLTDRSGKWEIWVMNADGGNPHLLLPSAVQGRLGLQYGWADDRSISWR